MRLFSNFGFWAAGLSVQACDLDEVENFIQNVYDAELQPVLNDYKIANFNYQTNLTDANQEILNEKNKIFSATNKKLSLLSKEKFYDCYQNVTNFGMHEQIKTLLNMGTAILDEEDLAAYNNALNGMKAWYSEATVETLDLATLTSEKLIASPDFYEKRHYWQIYHDKIGQGNKDKFEIYKNMKNLAAEKNGDNNTAIQWRQKYVTEGYTDQDFLDNLDKMFEILFPLYKKIHAYVRFRLNKIYGDEFVSLNEPIPAHLLGNMWAQQWGMIYNDLVPYPEATSIDIGPVMQAKNYTARKLQEISEEFFISLGFPKMPDLYWEKSVFEKPENISMVCHGSAWDMFDTQEDDYRVKMCTQIDHKNWFTVHHEMGHIAYFQMYKNQSVLLRTGANPGFHEAVGDSLALSVNTPSHLYKMGLLNSTVNTREADINYLMKVALDKIVFLPFGYLVDKHRWDIFDGSIDANQYQENWDNLRLKYQGIVPPSYRDPFKNMDSAAKYHVSANTPYIRYFISFILQFQFYEKMCLLAGEYDPTDPLKPLHNCDFYQSTEAGDAFKTMLSKGASEPWPKILKEFIGTDQMDTTSLVNYFKPLEDWLDLYLETLRIEVGWDDSLSAAEYTAEIPCFDILSSESTVMTEKIDLFLEFYDRDDKHELAECYLKISQFLVDDGLLPANVTDRLARVASVDLSQNALASQNSSSARMATLQISLFCLLLTLLLLS